MRGDQRFIELSMFSTFLLIMSLVVAISLNEDRPLTKVKKHTVVESKAACKEPVDFAKDTTLSEGKRRYYEYLYNATEE